MRQKPGTKRSHGEKVVDDIRRGRRTSRIASKAFLPSFEELLGPAVIQALRDALAATSTNVKDLRREARDLKVVVAM